MICPHNNTEWQEYNDYRPSQEQIDLGTDHDETGYELVCLDCKSVLDPVTKEVL